MHIFHKYGPWIDIAAIASGGILIQERRCAVCNKVRRRQTRYLGGDYDRPISSAGHKPKTNSEDNDSTLGKPPTQGSVVNHIAASKIRESHVNSRNYTIDQVMGIINTTVESDSLKEKLNDAISELRLSY